MNDTLSFLVTVLYGDRLLRCALKVPRSSVPDDASEYPMGRRDELHALLPLHVQSCGPIVEVVTLFEIADLSK